MFKKLGAYFMNQKRARKTLPQINEIENEVEETGEIKMAKSGKAAVVLMAYMGFKQPDKKRREYLIPKDKAAWLEYLVHLVKRKTTIEYLSEKELRKVIIRARPNLAGKKPVYKKDPDLPRCMDWTEEHVAQWISDIGFPYLKQVFLMNHITGKRLVSVDCTALNRMGMNDLTEMMNVTANIRSLLDIPRPNMLRALMRIPPFETFLKRRVPSGKTYDTLTFEKFCKDEGFNYSLLRNNKNAVIPCTCEVRVVPIGVLDDDVEDLDESEDEDLSLLNAPSVEFTVRNLIVRDKTVQMLIEDIMESIFCTPPESRKYGKPIASSFKEALDKAWTELREMTSQQRLEFATWVANALLEELRRTAAILNDTESLQKYIKEEVSEERLSQLRETAGIFMDAIMPLSALMAFGEFDLDTIFKQEPEFHEFVDGVVNDAEEITNEVVPDAIEFVDSVIGLALKKLNDMHLPEMEDKDVDEAKKTVEDILNEIMQGDGVYPVYRDIREISGVNIQTDYTVDVEEDDDRELLELFGKTFHPPSEYLKDVQIEKIQEEEKNEEIKSPKINSKEENNKKTLLQEGTMEINPQILNNSTGGENDKSPLGKKMTIDRLQKTNSEAKEKKKTLLEEIETTLNIRPPSNLGEGQREETIGSLLIEDRPLSAIQPRGQLTLSSNPSTPPESRGKNNLVTPPGQFNSRAVSNSSILSKHSEMGDQPLIEVSPGPVLIRQAQGRKFQKKRPSGETKLEINVSKFILHMEKEEERLRKGLGEEQRVSMISKKDSTAEEKTNNKTVSGGGGTKKKIGQEDSGFGLYFGSKLAKESFESPDRNKSLDGNYDSKGPGNRPKTLTHEHANVPRVGGNRRKTRENVKENLQDWSLVQKEGNLRNMKIEERLAKMQEEWKNQEISDMDRRRLMKLEKEHLEKEERRKMQDTNARKIWEEIQNQERHVNDKDADFDTIDDENIERDFIEMERKKKIYDANQFLASTSSILSQSEHIQNVTFKRKQLVEDWAKTIEEAMSDVDKNNTLEEQSRLVRITADNIVTQVINYALTHMLLQAEAGKEGVMLALNRIKKTTAIEQDHDIILWDPNLPKYTTSELNIPLSNPSPANKKQNKKPEEVREKKELKEEMKQASKKVSNDALIKNKQQGHYQKGNQQQKQKKLEDVNPDHEVTHL